MGFYGNITNTNRTQFVFDKIYPNRKAMDKGLIDGDGVFIGRYVLVDYHEGTLPTDSYARLYYNNECFYFSDDFAFTSMVEYTEEPYYLEDGSINEKRFDPAYNHNIFANEIFYVLNPAGVQTFYIASGKTIKYGYDVNNEYTSKNTILATKITAPADSDIYFKNYAEDKAEYPEMKNGYDSTVWQKVYTDDEEKYVNIAELNSVVPTFGLTVDAPTINPIKPHFDADSTNVYYRLHVQPAAGIRIADSEEKWGVYEGHGSDETVSSYEYNWDPEAQEKKSVGKTGYKGAIYYNSDGFKSDYRYKKNDKKDKIAFGLTGSSGARYNTNHGAGTSVSAVKSPDIYELAINLPSIGNTISEVWDLVYGTGKLINNEKDAPANIQETYQRNTNIDWNNIAGERLVREKIDGSGFEYNTDQVNTIAGCINSVHDLMGMIITQESQKQDESDEEYKERISIDNSLTNRIYYGNYEPARKIGSEPYKGYYIKNLTYEIKEGKQDVYEPVTLKDFFANNYYYIDNNNYYLETYGYRAGNKYYNLDNRIFNKEDLYEKDWEKNKYYYLKDGDYVIDGNTWPDADIQYFDITPGYKDVVDSDVYKFFFPTTEEYFNAYFKDTRSEKDKDGKAYGNGLFYYDNDDKLYKPFYVGLPYTQTLYWWRNYMVETSTDITGKPVEVYDFEKGAVCDTYTMYDLTDAETKYYWLNPETDNYELITNELELIERDKNGEIVPISKKYSTFKVESVVEIPGDFYEPDEYYYKEGNDYILAREEKRAKDLDSYFVIDRPSQAVTDTFYEPNKYYLKIDKDNYILDTDEFNEDGEYYLIHYLHVKEDPNGVFAPGTKINKHIKLSDFPDLKYGPIYEKYEWKELVGFGRTLNTINGLILDLNNLIKTNDTLTRDRKTIQGCINSINDILDSVYELIPDYFIAVDKYGRMTSMKPIGDDWIQVDVNKEDNGKVIITHIGPVEKDARNENNETPEFGSTFEIEDWVFDDKGHQTNKSVHTVKIPQGSLSDQTKTGSDIITQLSFVPSTGALTSTRENLSSIKLADYVKDNDNNDVAATDTLGQALSKLQTQIIEEEEARATIIDALDMNDEDTAHFISKITQTDGKVSVVRAAAGTLKIADADGSYLVPETSSRIEKEDTLAVAFGKVEAQIDAANKTRENDITTLTNKVDTEIQDRKDAIAKEVEDRNVAILVETNARTNAINGLNNTINGLNANISTETSEIITAITQTAGLVSASKEKVGNLTLTGWAIGEVDADNTPIENADTIFNAFVKTQRQINANKKALDLLNGDSSKVDSVNYKIENALTNYNLTNLAGRVDNLEQTVPAEKIAIWDGVVSDYVSKAVYNEALNKIQNLEGRIAALEALIIPPEPPTETEPDNGTEEP